MVSESGVKVSAFSPASEETIVARLVSMSVTGTATKPP
jgi:hypothetical protein